jgi:hypothetical protein
MYDNPYYPAQCLPCRQAPTEAVHISIVLSFVMLQGYQQGHASNMVSPINHSWQESNLHHSVNKTVVFSFEGITYRSRICMNPLTLHERTPDRGTRTPSSYLLVGVLPRYPFLVSYALVDTITPCRQS